MAHETPEFRRILVIHFGQLGDVVLGLPALQAIRDRFPASHIAALTGHVPGEVVRMSGLADEAITVDRVELRDGPRLRSIGKILKFVREMRRREIDLIIDLHSLSETNLLAFLTRAKYRLLANRENRSLDRLSNFHPKPPVENKSGHLSDRYLDVLRPLDIAAARANVSLHIAESDTEYVRERYFQNETMRFAGYFPGAGNPSRCWSLENFAGLAARLETEGLNPLVFLGPEESHIRAAVGSAFPSSTIIIDDLSIAQFIAATAQLELFVTNDTGPMHLAACADTPILLLLDKRAPLTYLPNARRLVTVRTATIDKIDVGDVHLAAKRLISPANDK